MAAPETVTVAPGLLRCSTRAGGRGGGRFDDFLEIQQRRRQQQARQPSQQQARALAGLLLQPRQSRQRRQQGEPGGRGVGPQQQANAQAAAAAAASSPDLLLGIKLTRLVVSPFCNVIGSIQTTYSFPASDGATCEEATFRRGGTNGDDRHVVGADIALDSDCVIISMTANQRYEWGMLLVCGLEFGVLDTRSGQVRAVRCGRRGGQTVTVAAPEGHCIAGFYGQYGHYIDSIGAYFQLLLPWTEAIHRLFPSAFKEAAKALLLCWRLAPSEAPVGRLPWEAVRCILLHLAQKHLEPARQLETQGPGPGDRRHASPSEVDSNSEEDEDGGGAQGQRVRLWRRFTSLFNN